MSYEGGPIEGGVAGEVWTGVVVEGRSHSETQGRCILPHALHADRLHRLGLKSERSITGSRRSNQAVETDEAKATDPKLLALGYVDVAAGDQATMRFIARVLNEPQVRVPERSANGGAFEEAYRSIGGWSGPHATREGREGELKFWQSHGKVGLCWLIERLRLESGIEVIHGVAEVLAAFGPSAPGQILRELQRSSDVHPAYALLLALSWSAYQVKPELEVLLEHTVKRSLNHANSDVREAGAGATRLLESGVATKLLRARLVSETDAAVRETLIAELGEREGK